MLVRIGAGWGWGEGERMGGRGSWEEIFILMVGGLFYVFIVEKVFCGLFVFLKDFELV